MGFLSSLVDLVFGKSSDPLKSERNPQYQRSERPSEPVRPQPVRPVKREVDVLCRKVVDADYVANLRVGRSWVLPQMVQMGFSSDGEFVTDQYLRSLRQLPYSQLWRILIRNVKALQKLQSTDPEGYRVRARWWNKEVALAMVNLDCSLLRSTTLGPTYTNSFGGPYVDVKRLLGDRGMSRRQYFFVSQPNADSRWNASNSRTLSDLYDAFSRRAAMVANAKDPSALYAAVIDYYQHRYLFKQSQISYQVPTEFIQAYAGDGAYSAMLTMVKHLNLAHLGDAGTKLSRDAALADIEAKAELYSGNGLLLLEYCRQKYFDRGAAFDYRQYCRR